MRCKWVKFQCLSVLSLMLCGMGHGLAAERAAGADERVEIDTELIAEVRESAAAGGARETHRFLPATTLSQGQVVYYTVRIINRAAVAASDVAVVQRIPANTTYVPGSAAGPGAEVSFSADGGQSFAPAGRITVDVDGREQRAAPEQYTHIRWQLRNPLAPGAVALARFRAVFR
jgi:uncharacterized repeat protein (TIGR01451 family)